VWKRLGNKQHHLKDNLVLEPREVEREREESEWKRQSRNRMMIVWKEKRAMEMKELS
jgi:hypothetical protein